MMIAENRNITFVHNSLQGNEREKNQDDVLILSNSDFFLFVLFDGVSSLSGSWDFIQTCKHFIKENYDQYVAGNKTNLKGLIYQMHVASFDSGENGKSTCSALLLKADDDKAYAVSIGDSRIYAFTNTYMEVLTTDDNLPGNSNLLTQYIGLEGLRIDDIDQIRVNENQDFLVCSDGFYSLMEKDLKNYFKILHYKRKGSIINAIKRLQKNKNRDDSTFIIIRNDRI